MGEKKNHKKKTFLYCGGSGSHKIVSLCCLFCFPTADYRFEQAEPRFVYLLICIKKFKKKKKREVEDCSVKRSEFCLFRF